MPYKRDEIRPKRTTSSQSQLPISIKSKSTQPAVAPNRRRAGCFSRPLLLSINQPGRKTPGMLKSGIREEASDITAWEEW